MATAISARIDDLPVMSGPVLAERVARIKSKLTGLAGVPDAWLPATPVPEEQLADFETREGIVVPAQFRCFAIEVGVGGPGPGGGVNAMELWAEAIYDPEPGVLAMPCPVGPDSGFR